MKYLILGIGIMALSVSVYFLSPALVSHKNTTQAALASPKQADKQASETVRFVTFGDFGTGAQTQYAVANAIQKKCQTSGCDFALTLGDNIYNNGVKSVSDPQFQDKFEKPYAGLNFPFYMILGNHDYRGNVQAQLDYSQHSKKWTLPARYYSFDQGPATFLALDTNQANEQQLAELLKVSKQSTRPWKILFGHHPRYTNSGYKNTQSPALKKLIDGFCGQAQIYLSGHEHDKQHLKPVCGMEHLIVGTGAGQRQVGKGSNTLFAGNDFGFAWVSVSPQKLHFELINAKGQLEYQHDIKP